MLCLELVLIAVFLLLFWGVGGFSLSFVVLGVFWGRTVVGLFCFGFELLCSSRDLTELLQLLHLSRADRSMDLNSVI